MDKGKDLTEVRSPQRQLAPDTVGLEQSEPTFLRGIANTARSGASLMALSCAKASMTEEPDAGIGVSRDFAKQKLAKPHVRVCAGGAG